MQILSKHDYIPFARAHLILQNLGFCAGISNVNYCLLLWSSQLSHACRGNVIKSKIGFVILKCMEAVKAIVRFNSNGT